MKSLIECPLLSSAVRALLAAGRCVRRCVRRCEVVFVGAKDAMRFLRHLFNTAAIASSVRELREMLFTDSPSSAFGCLASDINGGHRSRLAVSDDCGRRCVK